MRLLHTSDWHASRLWKGRHRTDELARVLDNLADVAIRERVDILLHTGDVFDHAAPHAEAERVVFQFFRRVGTAGIRCVVLAGNHDHPARMEAWGGLAELVGVHTVPRPVPVDGGGVVEMVVANGQRARMAVLPFAAPHLLVGGMDLLKGEQPASRTWVAGMRTAMAALSARFAPDAVNILMAHTHLLGARFSGSERQLHITDAWAADPADLPTSASYVALGHIHRPQAVPGTAVPTHYAGSPLQLDFGEAGEAKSFVLVDAAPGGGPAEVQTLPYEGAIALAKVRVSLTQLERDAPRLAKAGHLHVTVLLDAPDPDLASRVRRLVPNTVVVDAELPPPIQGAHALPPPPPSASPRQLYEHYRTHVAGQPADPDTVEAFEALWRQAGSADGEQG